VDDLEEVLEDPEFSGNARRILFSERASQDRPPYLVCGSWDEVARAVFG
jgi:hypothetical protein